uniref:GRAM domain containing 4b n=1 Tax=Neogobius melanostomus TaxID=47308 RepID=A0A8C6TFL6_9GOBI
MLRRLDRIRFRGTRREEFVDLNDSPSDNEGVEEVPVKAQRSSRETRSCDMRTQRETYLIDTWLLIAVSIWCLSEEELQKLKEETNIESLKQDLERERNKRIELEQKVNDKQKESLYDSFLKWIYDRFGVYIEDFRLQPEEAAVEVDEPLSARRLTENMRRLKRGFRPVTNFMRNLSALSSWYSVYTTAISFLIYMYMAWYGWTIPMFLFLAIIRLSLNYLIARGWRIQWSIVPEIFEPVELPKEELTVSEKFQLNIFGKMANILEKIKNLFMWVQPELTQKLYVGLWVAFLSSCFIPFQLLGFIIGMYAGIKFFVIDFFYKRSPKLRRRFDTPYVIWTSLPTDVQLKERSSSSSVVSRRATSTSSRGNNGTAPPVGASRDEETGRAYTTKRGPSTRCSTSCDNGWRCCLINRDKKTPTDYIRNGVLFITENYLCFEASTSRSGPSKRNKVIGLCEITEVQKYKVLSVLPGSGMGISIATPTTQKVRLKL